jgi:hypothetical protein
VAVMMVVMWIDMVVMVMCWVRRLGSLVAARIRCVSSITVSAVHFFPSTSAIPLPTP